MARIYISSPFKDLVEHRKAARAAIDAIRCEPVGMDTPIARDEGVLAQSLEDVRSCDVYMCIVAWRYGSRPAGFEKSVTHLEFEAAREAGLSRLHFLHDEDQKQTWDSQWIDPAPDADVLRAFRAELEADRIYARFTTPSDLRQKITESLGAHFHEKPPRKRADVPEILPYMADRSAQFERLDEAVDEHRQNAPTRPLVVVIHGGEREAHHRFLERLRDQRLPRNLGQGQDLKVAEILAQWSETRDSAEVRQGRMWRALAETVTGDRKAAVPEVARRLADHRSPVIVRFGIPTQTWQPEEPALVERWLRMWSEWPDGPREHPLLPILSIQYKDTQLSSRDEAVNRDVAAFVEGLRFDQYPGLRGVVLPRLESVEEHHVVKWLEKDAEEFWNAATRRNRRPIVLREELRPAVADLFAAHGGRIPMEPLARALREQLLRCLA